MTNRRRYLISAAVLVACVCVALGVLAMLPADDRPGVTKANFDKIQDGMTKPDVENLLGLPSEESSNGRINWGMEHNGRLTGGHERVVWGGDDGAAVVVFHEAGRIAQKAWVDNRETFPDKFRHWLHLPK